MAALNVHPGDQGATSLTVAWWSADLRCVVLERADGKFCVGTVYDGTFGLDDELTGNIPNEGVCQLHHALTGAPVWLSVEACDLSEADVSDLITNLRV